MQFMHACNFKVEVMPLCQESMYIVIMRALTLCEYISGLSVHHLFSSLFFPRSSSPWPTSRILMNWRLATWQYAGISFPFSISAIALAEFYTDSSVHPL